VLSLVRSEPQRAETALEDLAELFRVLMRDNRDLTPLDDEVLLCRQYLDLEKLRLGDRLIVDWNVKSMPGDALVHFETFLDAGLGAALTETDATRGVRPMVAAGIGQRVFLGESFALTARIGGNVYAERLAVNSQPTTHAMGFWSVQLGLSWFWPQAKEDR